MRKTADSVAINMEKFMYSGRSSFKDYRVVYLFRYTETSQEAGFLSEVYMTNSALATTFFLLGFISCILSALECFCLRDRSQSILKAQCPAWMDSPVQPAW